MDKRDGGKATIVRLPEIEVHGGSHALMQENLQGRIVSMMLGQLIACHGSASRTGWRSIADLPRYGFETEFSCMLSSYLLC